MFVVTLGFLYSPISAQLPTDDIVFPADAKVIDVTKPPFNAMGDGKSDDTAALQAALNKTGLIYVPAGTYLVSNTLRWGGQQRQTVLQGQHRDKTIILLRPGAAGFGNLERVKPVLWTGTAPGLHPRNGIRDLTVSVGPNNLGAAGIQFMANQQGSVRDVRIAAAPGSGAIGLDLGYTADNGPCLIQRVEVSGFEIGVYTKEGIGITFDYLFLKEQRRFGFLNDGQFLSIRKLKSTNAVTGFVNRSPVGFVTLLESDFTGLDAASGVPAVENNGAMFVRFLGTAGYKSAIADHRKNGKSVAEPNVEEWQTDGPISLFPDSKGRSLNIPVEDAPRIPWDPPSEWANVLDYREPEDESLTEALNRAVMSGRSTVYFPPGRHMLGTGHVRLPATLQRLIGLESELQVNWSKYRLTVSADQNRTEPLIIERFSCETDLPFTIAISGAGPVVLSSISIADEGRAGSVDVRTEGAAKIYIEDLAVPSLRPGGVSSWIRQLCLENSVRMTGICLWGLGVVGRGRSAMFEMTGGRAEVFGGRIYSAESGRNSPFLISKDSKFCFSFSESVGKQRPFEDFVIEERKGEIKKLNRSELPVGPQGPRTTLFVGH